MDIWQGIQYLLTSSGQEGKSLYLRLHTISDSLLMQLKQFCSNFAGRKMEILVCAGSEAEHLKSVKIKRLQRLIELLLQKTEIGIYCYRASDETGQSEQNWITSEDCFIQFTDDMSQGMMTRDAEWVAFFRDSFEQMRSTCRPICKKITGAMEYMGRYSTNEMQQMRVIEYMPCMSFGLTEEILQEGIYRQIPYREELIQSILEQYVDTSSWESELNAYFTKQGLLEFMESGKVELFPYELYDPFTMQKRCEILRNTIARVENESRIRFYLLKEDFVQLKGIHVEQRAGKQSGLSIEMHFGENAKEEIWITDEDIREEYWQFFEYLKKSGYTYSEEETLDFMKEVLAEYQKNECRHGHTKV